MKQLCILICCIVIAAASTSAQAEERRLAVLEFRGVGIEDAILHKLSDQARIAAANTLPLEEYQVMTREGLLEILKDMGKDISCLSGACEIEIARNIGADYIITGNVLQVEQVYLLTLKLHEAETGLIVAGQEFRRDSLLDLITDSQKANENLLIQGLNIYIIDQVDVSSAAVLTPKVDPSDCPLGETIYTADAYGHYVTINDQLWEVRSNKQQKTFMEILVQCNHASAALSFQQWRTRRKVSVISAVSMVGTFYVAPWTALASQKAKRDMLGYLMGEKSK